MMSVENVNNSKNLLWRYLLGDILADVKNRASHEKSVGEIIN